MSHHSPDRITLANLATAFLTSFPALTEPYEADLDLWDEKDEPNLFMAITTVFLRSWIDPLLDNPSRTADDELALLRTFEFIERMLESDDLDVQAIADTGIIEGFCDHPAVPDLLPLMPPRVRYWTATKIGVPRGADPDAGDP